MSVETPPSVETVSDDTPDSKFSFAEARSLIGDLTTPNPRIYWTDFLLSIIGGYVALQLTLRLPMEYGLQPWVIGVVAVTYVAT
ncbi:MAG: hypothetical protein AAFU85_31325, partial [Planctomycetota bacterium]